MKRDISWVFEDLLSVQGARQAVLASADGLQIGKSEAVSDDVADTLSALVSGLQSLSRQPPQRFLGADPVTARQILVEYQGGWLLVCAAGPGAYLAVSAGEEVDLGALGYQTEQFVSSLNLKNVLSAAPRDLPGRAV